MSDAIKGSNSIKGNILTSAGWVHGEITFAERVSAIHGDHAGPEQADDARPPRLAAEQNAPPDGPGPEVSWTLTGQTKDLRGGAHQTWLQVSAQARLGMVCQRCLEPMSQALEVDRPFRFVSNEQAADAEDDQAEEDLLVASPAFDAMTLIEDELIRLQKEYSDLEEIWKAEKSAVLGSAQIKEEIDKLKADIAKLQREGRLEKVAELQYGKLPQLEAQLKSAEAAGDGSQQKNKKCHGA